MANQVNMLRRELLSLYLSPQLARAILARDELKARGASAWLIALINQQLNSALMNVSIALNDDATPARLRVAYDRAQHAILSAREIALSLLRKNAPPFQGLPWLEDYERAYQAFISEQRIELKGKIK